MTPTSIVTGKKSNSNISIVEDTAFNLAAQDDGTNLVFDSSPGASVTFTDLDAIASGERIAQGGFDVVAGALSTIDRVAETFAGQAQQVANSSLNTANVRSQLPAETIAADNSELFRVGILSAAGVAVAFFLARAVS